MMEPRDVTRQAAARAGAVAAVSLDSACVICAEPYAATHLLRPTVANEVKVCPACVFDDNLWMEAHPQRLAYEIDQLARDDVAIPAAWAAVAAVLTSAAKSPRRANPGGLWIWLPPTDRPEALADMGAGASLCIVAAAVEAAHPNLRKQFHDQLDADLAEESGLGTPLRHDRDCLVERLWPAAIAYAVTFATDRIERSGRRPSRLDLHDFIHERPLTDHFAHLGSRLAKGRGLDALLTLEVGARVVARALVR